MNRSKFRVWDKEMKRMHLCKGTHDSLSFDSNGNAWYYNLQNGSGGDEYELMQFTGLQDSKNKEIYDGDIIKIEDEYMEITGIVDRRFDGLWQIDYEQIDCHAFSYNPETGEEIPEKYIESIALAEELFHCVIIGNVFENPEILKNNK